MSKYTEFEEKVFKWLMQKRGNDNSLTFSVRRKANKGAESDYFIGTEKSNYFGTTFWYIPVAFPGSSSDLINLMFFLTDSGYKYHIQFCQTRNPHDEQNKIALDLIQSLKPELKALFPKFYENDPSNKMEFFEILPPVEEYKSIDTLLEDVDKDLDKVMPVIDKAIESFKTQHPAFDAGRYAESDFKIMIDKLDARKEKHAEMPLLPPVNQPITIVPQEKANDPLNQILFGPPGTGKTYGTIEKALEIIGINTDGMERNELREIFDTKRNEGQIMFTTFHQSMSYEDFIEGIKPLKPLPTDTFVRYDVQPGIFRKLCEMANSNYENAKVENKTKLKFEDAFEKFREEWDDDTEMKFPLKTEGYDFTITGFTNTSIQFKKANGGTSHTLSINTLRDLYYGKDFNFKQGVGIYYPGVLNKINSYEDSISKSEASLNNYILIIDEINRGNVSQIFGELITLIEEDKRLGKEEALMVTLPYSKEKFGVPPNLYIIGTMNTADRSVEALDTALRRRFSFEEMPPRYDLDELTYDYAGSKGAELLTTINKRIEQLLDKDHVIGHSYFMLREGEDAHEKLITSFYKNIIPLLQEYFFGDFGKIGLVLGKGFIRSKNWERHSNSFADFESDAGADFEDREIYEIIDYRNNEPITIKLKDKDVIMSFEKAVKLLMKHEVE